MKGYIEEGAWMSCSFDLSGTPQQLAQVKDRATNYVGYGENEKHLVRQDDTLVVNQFKCKLQAKKWGGLASLVTGFVGGVLIGVAILSGPVGWMLLGAVAAAAVVGGVSGYIAACMHDCNISLEGAQWKRIHSTVTIKGKHPALYNYSLIQCTNHGILVASETEEEAKKLSDIMKWNARGELGLQILTQSIMGVLSGYVFGKNVKNAGGFRKYATLAGFSEGDFLQPVAVLGEYVYSDFANSHLSAEEGAKESFYITVLPFGLSPLANRTTNPALRAVFKGLASEPSGKGLFSKGGDIPLALINYALDNGSNWIEEILSKNNANLEKSYDDDGNEIITTEGKIFQNFNNSTSKKSIIADK